MITRRAFLRAPELLLPNPLDMRVERVETFEEDYSYRTPIKFGGQVVDRVTLLNVRLWVRNRAGREAVGFGSMPLGNIWSWPSRRMSYDETLAAMREAARRMEAVLGRFREYGHPVELGHRLEPEWLRAAAQVQAAEPVPRLAALVAASPFDAALHDAYGKLCGASVYRCYGREHLRQDLSAFLGDEFRGLRLDEFVLKSPKPRMPLYHLVGALDPVFESDIRQKVGDGLPETLAEWIEYSGVTHLKIKLNGDDAGWDRDRVLAVERCAAGAMRRRGVRQWRYSLDFNERCPDVKYLLGVLRQIRERSPAAFGRIQYVEQPTHRDLAAHSHNVMHEAARLRPVVIDESLTDLESLRLAREMGYTGAALKACKGQTQSLLMAAAAQRWGMFLCVQDLTCPGASLIHSAGLAAHVPGVAAIEANARQYVPAANRGWEEKFPGIFDVRDGYVRTAGIRGPGLGAVA